MADDFVVGEYQRVPWWKTKRYWLAILLSWGYGLQAILRSDFSITIVCMVKQPDTINNSVSSLDLNFSNVYNRTVLQYSIHEDKYDEGCRSSWVKDSLKAPREGEFEWSKQLQGILLGATFWGYLSLQSLGGWLSDRYGAKRVIGVGLGISAIGTLLSPLAAENSPYLLLVGRLVTGLGTSLIYPSLPVFWSKWIPSNEWTRIMGLCYSGGQLGNALISPIGGFLCRHGFAGGWPSVFYVTGGFTFIWCVVWGIFAKNSPAEMSVITEEEKHYIEDSVKNRISSKRKKSIPWAQMLSSRPVIANIIAHTLANYSIYTLMTQMPTYMKEVLKFDIKSNGLFTMLPYLCLWMFILISGVTGDFLISRKVLNTGATRKLVNTLGSVCPAIFLVILAQMDCQNNVVAVVLLCCCVGFVGFGYCGHPLVYSDIALQYSGTLSGIGNTIATLPGILAPYVVANITKHGKKEEWQSAFYIAAAIFCLDALIFVFFTTSEVQPWAKPARLEHETFLEKAADWDKSSL